MPDPGNGFWELTVEARGGAEPNDQILINNLPVNPHILPPRAWEPSPPWVRHHFGVPHGVLQRGQNQIQVITGPLGPDPLEIRNISIRPAT